MATAQSTVDFILDQLVSLKTIRARKMFGEYALYANDKVVALICDDTLFVKITEHGKVLIGKDYNEGFPYPGAKPAMEISEGLLENREKLTALITATEHALPAPSNSKRKKATTSKKD